MKPVKNKAGVQQLLAKHPFLAGVKPSLSELFCTCATIQDFNPGQKLFCEGGAADYFYLIINGQVVLEVFAPGRGSVTIQAVGAGEALGWSWLFPPHHWRFSATAVQPTQVIAFKGKNLREMAQSDHEFCYELVVRLAGVLAGRLEEVRTRLIYTYEQRV